MKAEKIARKNQKNKLLANCAINYCTVAVNLHSDNLTDLPFLALSSNLKEQLQTLETFIQATSEPQREEWKKSIDEEYYLVKNHGVWELSELPHDRKAVGLK